MKKEVSATRRKINIISGIFLGIIILVFIIIAVAGGGSNKANSNTLASRTQKAYLKSLGYKSIADLNLNKNDLVSSPENEITEFSKGIGGNVNVRVQDKLTKDQAKSIAKDVMSLAGPDVKDLKSVTVQDYVGKDVAFVFRLDVGLTN